MNKNWFWLFILVCLASATFAGNDWNSDWIYWRDINITTPIDQNLYKFTKLYVNLDSNALIASGKLQSNCNDFRVVYNDLNVMDINVVGCGQTDTNIFFNFNTRKMGPNRTDQNFTLFYGNPAATQYPNSEKNYEGMFDDFSTDTIANGDWNYVGSSWSIANGQLTNASAGSSYFIQYNKKTFEIPYESDVNLVVNARWQTNTNNNSFNIGFADATHNLNLVNGFNTRYEKAASGNRVEHLQSYTGEVLTQYGINDGYWDMNQPFFTTTGSVISAGGKKGFYVTNQLDINNQTSAPFSSFKGNSFKVTIGNTDAVQGWWDNVIVNYLGRTNPTLETENNNALVADFNSTVVNHGSYATLDLNDLSISSTGTVTDWNWYKCFGSCNAFNQTPFSTDQNTFFTITQYGDWNIGLKIKDSIGATASISQIVHIDYNNVADFNYSFSPTYLDPESGINSISVILTDSSHSNQGVSIVDWNWYECTPSNCNVFSQSVFSTDQNTFFNVSSAGDYNVGLKISGSVGSDANVFKTVSIPEAPQGLNINYVDTNLDTNVTITFSYTATSDLNGATQLWKRYVNGANDVNSTNQSFQTTFNANANIQICVDVTKGATKTFCKNFWSSVALFKIPKDEITLSNLTPFSLAVDSNSSSSFTGLIADKNLFFFSDSTSTTRNVTVDFNSDYYQRTYSVPVDGGNYIIQPYLLSKTVGSAVTFYVKDLTTQASIPSANFTIKKILNNVLTTILSTQSDAAGTVSTYLKFGDTYYIDANYLTASISQARLIPINSSYRIYLNVTSLATNQDFNNSSIVFSFYPSGTNTIKSIGGFLQFDVNALSDTNNILTFVLTVNQGGVQVAQKTINYPNPQKQVFMNFPTIGDGNFSNGYIDLNAYIVTSDGNLIMTGNWYGYNVSKIDGNQVSSIVETLQSISQDFGQPGGAFLAIFLTILITGAAGAVFGSSGSLFIIGGFCLLVFALTGFLPLFIGVVACLLGIATYSFTRGGFW